MVIRRIREHVAAQNWFAVGIDFLIVVAGIVIGTQVNNWNQARIERGQGERYRARLIGDLRDNAAFMGEREAYYRQVRRHAVAALDALDRPGAELGKDFLIDAYQATQMAGGPNKRFTYDEILSAGATDSIGDQNLRERIAFYYIAMAAAEAVTSEVPPYRERLRRSMPYAAQQAVRTDCPQRVEQRKDSGALVMSLPVSCELRLDSATVAKSVAQVRAIPELSFDLTRQIVDIDQKLIVFENGQRRARQLRQIIETVDARS